MGTRYLTQRARSSSSRLLVLCTIRLTAKGASRSVSASPNCWSHRSNMPDGRALSEGKEPTIPARHWAITSAGCEMMNNGEPISRSEEHTSELQSLMRISYAVFCLTKKNIVTALTTDPHKQTHTNRTPLLY